MQSLSHWGLFEVPPGNGDVHYMELLFEQQLENLLFTTESLIRKIDKGDTVSAYVRHAAFALEAAKHKLDKYGRAQRDRSTRPRLYDALF